jgi:Leucine-rich repeat (LRR) protein
MIDRLIPVIFPADDRTDRYFPLRAPVSGPINRDHEARHEQVQLSLYRANKVTFAGYELIDIHRAYLDKIVGMTGQRPMELHRASYDGGIGKRSTERAETLLAQCHQHADPDVAQQFQPVLEEYEKLLDAKLQESMSYWKPCNQSNALRSILQGLNFSHRLDALGLPNDVASKVRACRESQQLNLRDFNLGEIDPERIEKLFELLPKYVPGLHTLTLYRTGLTSVPQALCHLTSLTTLNLGRNHLSNVPDALGNRVALRKLNLGHNQLTSLPDSLGNLTQVEQLNIGSNPLARISEALGNLTELELLNVQLVGNAPGFGEDLEIALIFALGLKEFNNLEM